MKLELKVERECNRLLVPLGRLGYGDTEFNRVSILNMLYRLGLITDVQYTCVSKDLDLLTYKDCWERNITTSILEDTPGKLESFVKITTLPEKEILEERARREFVRLLLPIGALGTGDSVFTRTMFLSVLERLGLTFVDDPLHVYNVISHLEDRPVISPLVRSIQDGLPEKLPEENK